MRNFDATSGPTTRSQNVTVASAPAVTERVRIGTTTERAYLIAGDWGWREVRDYVVEQMQQRWGAPQRPPVTKEAGIFKGFVGRWGTTAEMIVRYIFERRDGIVDGRRVKITDFTSAADARVAGPVAEVLNR